MSPTVSARLRTDTGFAHPDDAYAALIAAHQGLDEEASHQLNARLILLLANHIGDQTVFEEALAEARVGLADAVA